MTSHKKRKSPAHTIADRYRASLQPSWQKEACKHSEAYSDSESWVTSSSDGSFVSYDEDSGSSSSLENLQNTALPYQFEPEWPESDTQSDADAGQADAGAEDDPRLSNLSRYARPVPWCNWPFSRFLLCRCTCGHCSIMNFVLECVCCQEIPEVGTVLDQVQPVARCITEHPGFVGYMVLRTAYYQHFQKGPPRPSRQRNRK
jgi:hypothetical protein